MRKHEQDPDERARPLSPDVPAPPGHSVPGGTGDVPEPPNKDEVEVNPGEDVNPDAGATEPPD
ncbi:hypothetical protein ABZ639_25380 [Saccharomonospora sp. NPDC006951]